VVRKLVSLIAACMVAGAGAPPGALARAVGTVSGQALDAGGRPLANVRVELVEAVAARPTGRVVKMTVTGVQGAWAFRRVSPGEYVVRMAVGGHTAGAPVTVGGTVPGHMLIVAPSIATTTMQVPGGGEEGLIAMLGGTGPAVAFAAGVATGAALAMMAATDSGPFRDDQS
jgi:hypothetical protein